VLKRLLCCLTLLACGSAAAQGGSPWVEGKNYFRLEPAQPTSTPGKVEVLDVFSYACPACNAFQPTLDKLIAGLPSGVQMAYLPASFNPQEDWPVFQRAFLAAQNLGVAQKSHDAMYDAVWRSGSLAILDKSDPGHEHLLPKDRQPTIEDVAKFYSRYGVKPEDFLAMARSFTVEAQIKRSDQALIDYGVDQTPTLVVNGKYRLTPSSAGGLQQTIDLVHYLVAKEQAGG
jgi:protein dithiol oxidoreductase (disulfide-forming)